MALFFIFLHLLCRVLLDLLLPVAVIAAALYKLAGLSAGLSFAAGLGMWLAWLWASGVFQRKRKRAEANAPAPLPATGNHAPGNARGDDAKSDG